MTPEFKQETESCENAYAMSEGPAFEFADMIIQKVYPDWGPANIPNYGILRGTIAEELYYRTCSKPQRS